MSLPSLSLKVATRPQSCLEIPAGNSTPCSLRPLTVSSRPPSGWKVTTGPPSAPAPPGSRPFRPMGSPLASTSAQGPASFWIGRPQGAPLDPFARPTSGPAPAQADGEPVGARLGPRAVLFLYREPQSVPIEPLGPLNVLDRHPDNRHAMNHLVSLFKSL